VAGILDRWQRARIGPRRRTVQRAPEQLRHTFASTMLSRNAPLLYVQQQGGWRSAGILLRVYARWLPQDGLTLPAATPAQPAIAAVSTLRAGKGA
jgi:integrase